MEETRKDRLRRLDIIEAEANRVFKGDKARIQEFLHVIKWADAGNKTAAQMAHGSPAGLDTALCLLEPKRGA